MGIGVSVSKMRRAPVFIVTLTPRFSFSFSLVLPSIPLPPIRLRIDSSPSYGTTVVMESTALGLVRVGNTIYQPVADVHGSRGI